MKPQLKLVTAPGEIAPDVVYAIRTNAWADVFGHPVSVRSRPVELAPHFGAERRKRHVRRWRP